MMGIEIWKDVKGYEGLYKISNLGRLKSVHKHNSRGFELKEKILTGWISEDGYRIIGLRKGNERSCTGIHRLVALAFIPNPQNKPRVNHIDNNRTNNQLDNLEWSTHQEDIDHKCKQNRQNRPIGKKNPMYGKKGSLNPLYGRGGPTHWNYGSKSARARLVLDLQTGIFYDCVKDAAFAKNQNQFTLYNRLLGNRINNTSLIYV